MSRYQFRGHFSTQRTIKIFANCDLIHLQHLADHRITYYVARRLTGLISPKLFSGLRPEATRHARRPVTVSFSRGNRARYCVTLWLLRERRDGANTRARDCYRPSVWEFLGHVLAVASPSTLRGPSRRPRDGNDEPRACRVVGFNGRRDGGHTGDRRANCDAGRDLHAPRRNRVDEERRAAIGGWWWERFHRHRSDDRSRGSNRSGRRSDRRGDEHCGCSRRRWRRNQSAVRHTRS